MKIGTGDYPVFEDAALWVDLEAALLRFLHARTPVRSIPVASQIAPRYVTGARCRCDVIFKKYGVCVK